MIAGILLFQPPAYAKNCKQSGVTPKVQVNIKKGKLVYDISKSSEQLTNLNSNINNNSPSSFTVRGLASMKPTFKTYIGYSSRKVGNNSYCVHVTKINLTIGYKDLRVYIANNYSEGSCQFIAIMKHEVKHVAAYRQGMNRKKKLFEQILRTAASKLKTINAKSPKKAESIFMGYITKKTKPLYKKSKNKLKIANAKIDSPESYARTQKLCSTW